MAYSQVELEKKVKEAFQKCGWHDKKDCSDYSKQLSDCNIRSIDIVMEERDTVIYIETVRTIKDKHTFILHRANIVQDINNDIQCFVLTDGNSYDIIYEGRVYSELEYPPTPEEYRAITDGLLLDSPTIRELPCQSDTLLARISKLEQENEQLQLEKEELLRENKLKDKRIKELTNYKNKDIDEEQRFEQANIALDDYTSQISTNVMRSLENVCAGDAYKDIWDTLEDKSKTYLCTAYDLYRVYTYIKKQMDFAPVVLEYSRVFENELKVKLFQSFIIDCQKRGMTTLKCDIDDALLDKIARVVKNSRIECVYTLGNMLNSLKNTIEYKENEIIEVRHEMYDYLEGHWDINLFSETDFFKNATDFNDYRIKAAHPFDIMDKGKVERCKKLFNKVVSVVDTKRH